MPDRPAGTFKAVVVNGEGQTREQTTGEIAEMEGGYLLLFDRTITVKDGEFLRIHESYTQ